LETGDIAAFIPHDRRAFLAAAALAAVLILALPARAQEYASPRGFTLRVPEGWIVAPNDPNDANRARLAAEFPFLARVDPNRTSAFLFQPRTEGFAPQVGVDIIEAAVRANSENGKAALRETAKTFKRIGGAESNAAFELRRVADRSVVFIRHEVRYPGQEEWLRQWQALVPGKGRTLVVTCTAEANDFPSVEPAFTRILDSLQVPDRPGSLLADMPTLTKGLILGALLMGAIILLRVLRALKRKFPKTLGSPDH
jgi:hypothetical protein